VSQQMLVQSKIEEICNSFDGKVAVFYRDLKSGTEININSDEPWEGASCLKVFVLLELLNQVKSNTLKLSDKIKYERSDYTEGSGIMRYLDTGTEFSIKDLATLMMIISDNIATNILMDKIGIPNINNHIKEIGLSKTIVHNKFDWSKKEFCTFTAREYGHAFVHLAKIKEAKDIMRHNKYKEMIESPTMKANEHIKSIISKSGKIQRANSVRVDGGIVSTKNGDYVLVILLKDFSEADCKSDSVYEVGLKISEVVFNHHIDKIRFL